MISTEEFLLNDYRLIDEDSIGFTKHLLDGCLEVYVHYTDWISQLNEPRALYLNLTFRKPHWPYNNLLIYYLPTHTDLQSLENFVKRAYSLCHVP